jgi:4-amino-4-deoxy-L-arabinose transferase-like glycosyltransferase
MDQRKIYFLIVLAIGSLIFFFNLGGRDLWEPDETRYAVVARDMKDSGDWIIPHLNREIYAEKPPLFFWLVNLSVFFLGENSELANRLPSALAGYIVILITCLFGERLFNPRTGFLSSLILATSLFFPQLSRWMMLDSIFTLFFFLALFFFYLGYEKEERRRRYYLLAGLFTGLAILTKGPVAYLTLPIFLIFAAFQKAMKKFWCRDLLWGCLLSVGVVLIWWIPACWIGGRNYIHWILFQQAIGTYVEGGKHFHPEAFFFYLIRFPIEFLPWTVFLPTAFILGLRKGRDRRVNFLFLSIWFSFIFLFFTFSKGKKDNYLLPLYPAAAMIVGWLWDSGIRSEKGKKGFISGLAILGLLSLVPFVLFLFRVPQKLYPAVLSYHSLAVFILCYLVLGSLLSLLFFIKKRPWGAFISLVVIFTFLHLHITHSLPSQLNAQRSIKTFSERILKRMEPGDEIKTFWFKSNGLLYYTEKPYIEEIDDTDRFVEVFRSSHRVFIVILAEMFDQLKRDAGIEVDPVERVQVGHWEYVLISNH